MKKIFFTVMILVLLSSTVAQARYAPNGKSFTPKGDLRVLFVFVGFGSQ